MRRDRAPCSTRAALVSSKWCNVCEHMTTSTERSANGSAVALPRTALPVRARLATARVSAMSIVMSERSTRCWRASSRALAAMSPTPLPTSSSVAFASNSGRTAPSSSRTARVPPNNAFASATSASERRTRRGSTPGASRYSKPRRRGGVMSVVTGPGRDGSCQRSSWA